MELENGDEYGVPFFLFSSTDLELLRPGWERWTKYRDDEKAQAKEQFLLEAQARAYNQQQQVAAQAQQMQHLQLTLLAAATGVVDLWEIDLYPANGASYPLAVVVPAQNSEDAAARAMQQYPGYVAGESKRVR